MMNNIRHFMAVGILVIGGFSTAHADSVADKFGFSGVAAAAFAGGDESVMDHTDDVGHDFGGIFRVGLTPKWSVGASYDNINLFGIDGERHHPETILGNVFYHLSPERKLVPTLQVGVGAGSSLTDGAFSKISARTGLGLDYFFSPYFSAGPQLTYTFIANDDGALDEYHAFGAGLMVSLYFDKPRDEPPPAAPVAVLQKRPIKQKFSIDLNVLFDSEKSVVKPNGRSEIRKVADFMNKHPESTGEIEGHTDNTGDPAMNKRLSQERADAVRAYLIGEFQIDASRLTATGYGEEKPMADNATPEGRNKNRRVVATLDAVEIIQPNQ